MKTREIKFRVWDGKGMWYDIEGFSNDAYCINIKEDYWFSGKLMQFTGLRDKNEVDIYEGDIIDFKANYSSKRNGWLKGIVIFNEENYYKLSIKVGYDIYEVGEETDEFPYTCEVLGSIYESPSLLI